MIHKSKYRTIWLRKGFDLTHGFGWFCQVYNNNYNVGFGYSKNKFTAVRLALKQIGEIY